MTLVKPMVGKHEANETSHSPADGKVSLQSRVGLNAANFFLAEITGVVMPFLGAYLQGKRWSETAIGVALSLAGLPLESEAKIKRDLRIE